MSECPALMPVVSKKIGREMGIHPGACVFLRVILLLYGTITVCSSFLKKWLTANIGRNSYVFGDL